MKKIVTLMLAVLMVLSVVACAQPTAPAPAEDPAVTAEPAKDEAATAEEPAAGVDLGDPTTVKSTDGQVLMPALTVKDFPERPADPEALAEDDAGRYYDMEYAGWDAATKENIPESPADGPKGKKVIVIVHGDHPWTTAYQNGLQKAADFFGMEIEYWSPNWDVNVQNQLIEQAINAAPDAIGLIPLNAESATQQFRKINEAGIPVFGSNTLPTSDAMKYMVSWTGPDDWGQMRLLAGKLATAMNNKGGVCYITHNAGTSPYFARTYGPITEFKKIAPDIATLDIQTPGFDAVACKQVVSDWITRFGDKLTAIFLADDSAQAIGTIDALKEAGRTDVLVVAAGNSKQGMDLVKSGDLLAINYQTAEGDGGAVVYSMAKFFAGQEVPAIGYLAQDIITTENVDGFYPPQW
ncbi:MAG: substrate-binding domain-containing protein [Clostridia bacterium]